MEINSEYLLLQGTYRKAHIDDENAFPKCWYNVKEYNLKIEILKDCLRNNILIENSRLYNYFRVIALK